MRLVSKKDGSMITKTIIILLIFTLLGIFVMTILSEKVKGESFKSSRTHPTIPSVATIKPSGLVEKQPVWHRGDSWVYRRTTRGGLSYLYTLTVVEQSVFQGRRSYKLELKFYDAEGKLYEDFSKSFLHFSTELTYLGLEKPDGSIEEPSFSPLTIRWPIKNGKVWQIIHYEPWLNAEAKSSYSTSIERIRVEAGEFEIFKIVKVHPLLLREDKFQEEYWYSPKAKNFVKIFKRNFSITDELVSYKLEKHN